MQVKKWVADKTTKQQNNKITKQQNNNTNVRTDGVNKLYKQTFKKHAQLNTLFISCRNVVSIYFRPS
jgi:CRISPR/Cas system Type II protein with McrA/HNH and RuvC-like nuclease domain